MELMLTKPGTRVKLKNGKLEVSKEGAILGRHPANAITSLICLPGVHPTEAVISLMSRNGGKTVFLSATGSLKSMLVAPGDAGNVESRIHQFATFSKSEPCLELSKLIVNAKIHNMDRFSREFTEGVHEALKNLKGTVSSVDNMATLRGVEGLATRIYFAELRKRIPEKHTSSTRIKRFAVDTFNQVQSFVYSMLHHTIIGLIHGAGLDPYLGFYHQPSYNHAALASDLMESYRAQVCDRIILRAFKCHEFLEALADNTVSERSLGQEALTILRKAYLRRLEEEVQQRGEKKAFLSLMHGDVFGLRKHLDDSQIKYQPWISL